MGQMKSKVETEKNQVSQIQKMVKELQVFSFQIPVARPMNNGWHAHNPYP